MTFTTVVSYYRNTIAPDINDMVKKGWTFVSITNEVKDGGFNTYFILLFSKSN